jgi:hypothetical protein
VRACLTAIDHNTNVDRQPARDEDGEKRYNIVNSRDGQIWTAKPIMERKNYARRQEIIDEVVQVEDRNDHPEFNVAHRVVTVSYSVMIGFFGSGYDRLQSAVIIYKFASVNNCSCTVCTFFFTCLDT